jgi:lipopolysaccharide/colanic/teichoic acid biosynthesis glycosyltransferase
MRDVEPLSGTWTTLFSATVSPQALGPGTAAGWWPSPAAGLDAARSVTRWVPRKVENTVPDSAVLSPPVVLGAELFRSAVSRERRRADRFDELFALATVAIGSGTGAVDADPGAAVAAALNSATRESDVVGWVTEGLILGVLFADLESSSREPARHLQHRVQQELMSRLDGKQLEALDIQWYVHVRPGAGSSHGLSDTDPLLDDIRETRRRHSLMDAVKRALDIAGSLALLVLLAPVMLAIAALVKLTSPGPVLFRQPRVGQLAGPFTMLKFRSMFTQSDSAIHQKFVTDFIKSSSEQGHAGGDQFFKIVNDPRITPLGRILRKTSLDELPQLWNVLRGDMSLVGPRPPLRYELEQYRSWHWRRVLEAKPGITGLWQVTGRSRTTFDEMVRLDLRYVRTRSLWTDIRILLATPRAVVNGRGAC